MNNIEVPITEQLKIASRKGNRLSTAIGAVLGTVVPVMAWLGYASLGYLCLINAISAGCSIALESRKYNAATRKPRKAKACQAKRTTFSRMWCVLAFKPWHDWDHTGKVFNALE